MEPMDGAKRSWSPGRPKNATKADTDGSDIATENRKPLQNPYLIKKHCIYNKNSRLFLATVVSWKQKKCKKKNFNKVDAITDHKDRNFQAFCQVLKSQVFCQVDAVTDHEDRNFQAFCQVSKSQI